MNTNLTETEQKKINKDLNEIRIMIAILARQVEELKKLIDEE